MTSSRPGVAPPPGALDHIVAGLARTGDGGFVADHHGRIVAWNRAAEGILGLSAREVVGKSCCDVFHGYDPSGNRLCYPGCHIQSLVGMAEPVSSYDLRGRTKAGAPVWINVSVLPLTVDGEPSRVTLHLFRDVTATKELLSLVREHGDSHDASGSNGAAPPSLTRSKVATLIDLRQSDIREFFVNARFHTGSMVQLERDL